MSHLKKIGIQNSLVKNIIESEAWNNEAKEVYQDSGERHLIVSANLASAFILMIPISLEKPTEIVVERKHLKVL